MVFSRPNLFALAPSELSQDAVLAWLLTWADNDAEAVDPELHRAGRALIGEMFGENVKPPPGRVRVQMQWPGAGRTLTGALDILVEVGDRFVLAIEDKTSTDAHSGQLSRYAEAVKANYPDHNAAFIYLKTGDQSSYAAVELAEWRPFLRDRLLAVLRPHRAFVKSDIFQEFLGHLEAIEADVESWRTSALERWTDGAWSGFFMALRKSLGDGGWGKVNNPAGGFMGFWWAVTFVDGGGTKLYLQLEESELTAKVEVPTQPVPAGVRDHWSRALIAGVKEPSFVRPKRLGSGKWVTVAKLASSYRVLNADGMIDFDSTVDLLRRVQSEVASIAASSNTRP